MIREIKTKREQEKEKEDKLREVVRERKAAQEKARRVRSLVGYYDKMKTFDHILSYPDDEWVKDARFGGGEKPTTFMGRPMYPKESRDDEFERRILGKFPDRHSDTPLNNYEYKARNMQSVRMNTRQHLIRDAIS